MYVVVTEFEDISGVMVPAVFTNKDDAERVKNRYENVGMNAWIMEAPMHLNYADFALSAPKFLVEMEEELETH